ncbi:hypothetical protein ACFVIM_27370 [Streptomyces sp. NPDC057638]|uniref:hypothetical protein n=1 Tax=Streptomyces sp. NPDC057638 TaxID=3346190 RepID=UPI0036A2F42D
MTRDKKRKRYVRAVAESAGDRYARTARLLAGVRPPGAFQLKELLAECVTRPRADIDWGISWGEAEEEFASPVFTSDVLGGPVPYQSVLKLAGLLSQEGPDARLRAERVVAREHAVVAGRARRFELGLNWGVAYELCGVSGCPRQPVGWIGTRCEKHLAACAPEGTVDLAEAWAFARNDQHRERRGDPAVLEGSPEADLLVRVAVAQGVYEQAASALLHGLFEDPEMIDEVYWDPDEAQKVRDSMDRERARLDAVAAAAVRRIREETGVCAACREPLPASGGVPGFPPDHCSRECVPAPPRPRGHRHAWSFPPR